MSGCLILIVGIYAFCIKGRTAIHNLFAAITVSVSIWLVSYSIVYSCRDPASALFWGRVGYAGVSFIPALSVHFHLEFIKKRPIKAFMLPLYAVSILFVLLAQSNYLLRDPKIFFWGYYPQAAVLYPVFLLYFIPVLWAGPLLCITELLKEPEDRSLSPLQLKQLKYVVVAFLVASVGVVDFIPKFGFGVYPFAYLCIMVWLVIVSFAIHQYRLIDIDMAAELMQAAKAAAFHDALRIAHKVEEQAGQAGEIVKKLSAWARPSGTETQTERVHLSEALNAVLELIQSEIQDNKIEVRINLPPDLPPVQADKRQMEEILSNLLLNACHEMAPLGGVLTISAWCKSERVQVIIQDTGLGIARDRLENVFDPFFATKRLGKGTGLGLYLTKRLVEMNKGRIRIESAENEGTTATLELALYMERSARGETLAV
jgi:hypothetical protein